MSQEVIKYEEWDFDGQTVDVDEFCVWPQRYLDMSQFRDVGLQLTHERIFVISESRFEDLVIAGGHAPEWLTRISQHPTHDILFATSEDELLALTVHSCGCLLDETGRLHIVLDEWLYWRLAHVGNRAPQSTMVERETALAHLMAPDRFKVPGNGKMTAEVIDLAAYRLSRQTQ